MVLFNTNNFYISIGLKQVLPHQAKMELELMAMKKYFKFHRSSEPEPHYEIQFSAIPKTPLWGGEDFTLLQRKESVYSNLPLCAKGRKQYNTEFIWNLFSLLPNIPQTCKLCTIVD